MAVQLQVLLIFVNTKNSDFEIGTNWPVLFCTRTRISRGFWIYGPIILIWPRPRDISFLMGIAWNIDLHHMAWPRYHLEAFFKENLNLQGNPPYLSRGRCYADFRNAKNSKSGTWPNWPVPFCTRTRISRGFWIYHPIICIWPRSEDISVLMGVAENVDRHQMAWPRHHLEASFEGIPNLKGDIPYMV